MSRGASILGVTNSRGGLNIFDSNPNIGDPESSPDNLVFGNNFKHRGRTQGSKDAQAGPKKKWLYLG